MESELPIKEEILIRLKELYCLSGKMVILFGENDAAYALLNINEGQDKSINDYLDVSRLLDQDKAYLNMRVIAEGVETPIS